VAPIKYSVVFSLFVGALLHGLEDLIEENTGITTMTAEEPLTAVAIGTGKYIEFLSERK
jgi:rod shape-determining protein MreB